MKKVHNFTAGPCALPQQAIDSAIEALKDFKGTGIPVISISHRTKEWESVMDECRSLWKELLNIPDTHEVVFLGGGASMGFLYVAMNFLENKAAYLETGVWAKKALKEAKGLGNAYAIASSADTVYNYIPKGFDIPADLDYLHVTTNNTIYGTELHEDLDSPVPLIADMSSDIMSRPVDVSKYAMIYGGAQKNLAPAGVTFVIVRDDMLEKIVRPLPTMMNAALHVENNSMLNTPPVFPIYVLLETLRWMKAEGGLQAIYERNCHKADMLYSEIERNKLFRPTVDREDRSNMNICFVMNSEYEALAPDFLKFATERGIVGIKGHRLVGGFRASCYNAQPIEAVEYLVQTMQEFEKMHA